MIERRQPPFDAGGEGNVNVTMQSTTTERDGHATAAMVQANMKLVEAVARQVARNAGSDTEYAVLLSYGCEGLLDAARRFDPSRGVSFRAYARVRIRGSIIDGVRSLCPLSQRAHESTMALSMLRSLAQKTLQRSARGR